MNISRRTRTAIMAMLDDAEVELQFDPVDHMDILHQKVGDKLVVAYLVQDNDASNPLENCDGMGKIIGRGKYETRNHDESELFEALGLDRYGDPNYDRVADEVDAEWRRFLDGVSDETWAHVINDLGFDGTGGYSPDELINKVRDNLMDCSVFNEETVAYALERSERYITEIDPSYQQIRDAAKFLEFDPDHVMKRIYSDAIEAGHIGDRDAVMLDVYDHSGLAWSISGGGTQCRWDTSRGAGVWVPDESAREEIDRRAPVYAYYVIQETNWLRGKDKTHQLLRVLPTGNLESMIFSDDWGKLWTEASKLASLMPVPTGEVLARGRRYAAEELAQQAVDEYNKWLSGDCYGCVVETFQDVAADSGVPAYEQIDSDHCWSFIGSDNAEESLKSEFFEPTVESLAAKLSTNTIESIE